MLTHTMHGLAAEDVGCTGDVCVQTASGGDAMPVQNLNLYNECLLADNTDVGQLKKSPSQSDMPCSYLQHKLSPVLTNPSYGVPVPSVVLSGGDGVWAGGGEVCVAPGSQGYYTV